MALRTSKLAPYTNFILELVRDGATWTRIAQELSNKGVHVTGQGVSVWARRRAERIARKAPLLDPLSAANVRSAATLKAAEGCGGIRGTDIARREQQVGPHPMVRRPGGELDDLIDEAAGSDSASGALLLEPSRKAD